MHTLGKLYKFYFLLWLLFFSSLVSANSNVWLTNNTLSPLYINSALITSDDSFLNEKDIMWHLQQDKINPLETKKVAWFSRNQHLKANTLYRYVVCISQKNTSENCSINNDNTIRYQFDVIGKSIYGSTLRTFLQHPRADKIEVLLKDGLENWSTDFWNESFHLYGRSWLYNGEVFSSYHFLIDNMQPQAMPDNSGNKISVLTYNTQLMPFYAGAVNHLNHPDYRAQIIPTYITQYDVVILQELFDKTHRETLTNAMNSLYPYHTLVVGENDANILSSGVMIFSRYPIEVEDSIVFQDCAQEDCLANKGAIYARILKQDRIYHIFGTHLQASDTDAAQNARKHQLVQLKNFIQQKNIPVEQPILIAGDFNFNEGSPEFLNALHSLNVALPSNGGYRYSVDSTVNAMVAHKEQIRLDYIFFDLAHKQPVTTSSKVVILRDLSHTLLWPNFNAVNDAFNFSTFDLSDHFPVAVEAVF